MTNAQTKFIVIIGDPVSHSLSPIMHNTAYQQLGIENEFVYLASNTKIENIKSVIDAMRSMENFHGLTCTVPHKVEVLKYLDWIDPIAKDIGAVNTVVKVDNKLRGYNTDWLGVIKSTRSKIRDLHGIKVLVLGAGGAARAAIYGLRHEGAQVAIYNRSFAKAQELANESGAIAVDKLSEKYMQEIDLIFNATPLGMHPHETESPLGDNLILKRHILFDAVYSPQKTVFLNLGQENGCRVIHGWEMLLHQGTAQFEIFTGRKAPVAVMKNVLLSS